MRLPQVILVLLSLAVVSYAADVDLLRYFHDPSPRITFKPRRSTDERISEHGYPAERVQAITEDGYVITMFRIPYSHKLQNQNEPRPIVLIQHGLFSCSDGWVLNGPDDALPFLLADAGFDVFLGNARGNTYSRNHTTRSVNHPYFWRFSWHEIGFYDLAAMIDTALEVNGQGQTAIHYVGHSQGTTAFFALLASRPEYNAKIKTAHMLAPVAFMSNMSDPLVRTLAPFLGHHNTYSRIFGSQEFIPYNDLFILLAYNACGYEGRILGLCSEFSYMLEGDGVPNNVTALPGMAETHPAGASTDQICHYMQEQQSGCFCRFDYGTTKNLKVYGQEKPTDYEVWLITAEMHMWYSDNDSMAAVVDVLRLADMLPNKVMHHMDDPRWAHGDFSMAMEVKKYINDPIIAIMHAYEDGARNM